MQSSVLSSWSSNLDQDVRAKLFTTGDVAWCKQIERKLENMLHPMRSGTTARSFIWFWDTMIRALLDFEFISARFVRYSNNSSTKNQRPDFAFQLHDVCVFRGVEKEPGTNISEPRKELGQRLVWIYGEVPYVLAYAASGYKIDLFALVRDIPETSKAKSVPIKSFDLERASDRFRFVLALLNLSLLFTAIAEACPHSAKGEYQIFKRSDGVEVRLYPTLVEKIFPNAAYLEHLELVYHVLKNAEVPNVDRITQVKLEKKMILFEPRGVLEKPSNLLELLVALRNVLEALVVLHGESWMHRYVRWPNVIKRRNCNAWLLIDFADAAKSPQSYPSGEYLSKEEHAPEIFVEGGVHTTAVDLWAVGLLVEESGVAWDDLGERTAFVRKLMQEYPTSRPAAVEALHDLVELEKEAKREQEAARGLQPGDQRRNVRSSQMQSRKRPHPFCSTFK